MDKKKRNVAALGVLTIIAALIFYWGFYYLLGNPVFKGGMDVIVALQNGAGLKRGDRVVLNGVIVGSVKAVRLVGSGSVIVEARLNQSIDMPADTRAKVSGDVFGAHAIELIPGDAIVKLEKGDTIAGVTAPALTEMAGELTGRAGVILTRADSLLSEETIRNLRMTSALLPATAADMRAALAELRPAFAELKVASTSLRKTALEVENAKTGEALRTSLARLDSLTRAFGVTATNLDRSIASLQSVITKIDGGQGTLGRLVNDTALYAELLGTAREFRLLAADVRARPRRYINLEIF